MKITRLAAATAIGVTAAALGAVSAGRAAAGADRARPVAAASVPWVSGARALTPMVPNGHRPATLLSPAHPGGVVTLGVGGKSYAVPVSRLGHRSGLAAPAGVTYPLTVHATDLAGKPDSGDAVVVASVDNPTGFAGKVLHHGVATFTVPAGHYLVAGFFLTTSGRRITGQHVVILPQATVAGASTVRIAARSASSEVQMVTPRPASLLWATLDIYRATASGQLLDIGAASTGQGPIWVNPTSRPPTVGTLRTVTAAGLISPPGSPAPYEYNLLYESSSGLIPGQRRVVRPATLATVNASYYQAVRSAGQLYQRGLLPFQGGIIFGGFFPVSLPSHVTQYLSGNGRIVWFDEYAQTRPRWAGGQLDAHRGYLAGQRASQAWGAYPLHSAAAVSLLGAADPWARQVPMGTVPTAARAGDTLLLDVDPFGDNQPGHLGGGYNAGSYRIDQNGTKIAGGNAVQHPGGWAFLKQVTLSPDPSVIRLTLAAARSGTLSGGRSDSLSTATRTVWTWRSAHQAGAQLPPGWWCGTGPVSPTGTGSRACAAEPMMTLRYQVQNLALDGSAPPGLQLLRLAVGHVQLAPAARIVRAAVQVSFDDGRTWHQARVAGRGGTYTALFTAPAGARVTLRTSAADAAGGSVTETITRGYAIAPRPEAGGRKAANGFVTTSVRAANR